MSEECNGFIAKDENGVYWRGTFGNTEEAVKSNIVGTWMTRHKFKIVKVKLVEVE